MQRLAATLLTATALWWGTSESQAIEVDGSFSGSWFDDQRSGEGWVLQVLADDRAFLAWFTYPAMNSGVLRQAWLVGEGLVNGDRVIFENLQQVAGPTFGPAFDPDAVVVTDWGNLEIQFLDCDNATLTYAGPAEFGSATRSVIRLTELIDAPCSEVSIKRGDNLRPLSATWFDPTHDGEGWFLEELVDGRVNMYWFTFDDSGNASWLTGVGQRVGDQVIIDSVFLVTGPEFGDGFDPGAVTLEAWGNLTFELLDCETASLDYDSELPGFGSGHLDPVRLTQIDTISCFPQAPLNAGTWQQIAPSPTLRSEVTAAALDGRAYLSGGFGGPRKLESYDLDSNSWTVHPDMPDGKNHHMAVGHVGELYVFGGNAGTSFNSQTSAYAFNPETQQWRRIRDLPTAVVAANVALSLDQAIYLVGGQGASMRYDPVSDEYQPLPSPSDVVRDHSSSVVLDGEFWLLGGRDFQGNAKNAVEIFDPVESAWRNGPSMLAARSGFGAAVVQGQIMAVGGEVFQGGGQGQTLNSFEVYAPSLGSFVQGPNLPLPLHGIALVSLEDRLLVLGGSSQAGSVFPAGLYFVYLPATADKSAQ